MEGWRAELYHHGILGQKWGKRNGPPYPLGSGDHSASEKKAGWRKSLSIVNKPSTIKKRHNNSEDRVVLAKQGETVNHVKAVRPFKIIKNGRALYVSKSQEDKETYLTTLVMDRDNFEQNVYNTKLTVLQDLVSPSETARAKEFVDMYLENRTSVAMDIAKAKRAFSVFKFRSEDSLAKKYQKMNPEDLYDIFAQTLTLNVNGQSAYFNRLKEKGYTAWLDDHDTKNGMGVETAMVVLDPIKSLKVSEIEMFNSSQLDDIFQKQRRKMFGRE